MLERTSNDFQAQVKRYLRAFLAGLAKKEAEKGVPFSFSDCAIGNCVLIGALLEENDSWPAAIKALEKLLVTRGHVELVSEENLHLFAVCEHFFEPLPALGRFLLVQRHELLAKRGSQLRYASISGKAA